MTEKTSVCFLENMTDIEQGECVYTDRENKFLIFFREQDRQNKENVFILTGKTSSL